MAGLRLSLGTTNDFPPSIFWVFLYFFIHGDLLIFQGCSLSFIFKIRNFAFTDRNCKSSCIFLFVYIFFSLKSQCRLLVSYNLNAELTKGINNKVMGMLHLWNDSEGNFSGDYSQCVQSTYLRSINKPLEWWGALQGVEEKSIKDWRTATRVCWCVCVCCGVQWHTSEFHRSVLVLGLELQTPG